MNDARTRKVMLAFVWTCVAIGAAALAAIVWLRVRGH
jgi:hypothetical protein